MSYENPRINDLAMTLPEIVAKLADGNPGAVSAMIACIQSASAVDPDSAFGPLSPLLSLDTLDCYGSSIWMFYKDVCGCDAKKMLGLMRANQFGFVSNHALRAAIAERGRGLDIPALLSKVKERLPAFDIGNDGDRGPAAA